MEYGEYFALGKATPAQLRTAREAFNQCFGRGMYRTFIAPLTRLQGPLNLFETPRTKYTSWFIAKVTVIVNSRLAQSEEEKPHGNDTDQTPRGSPDSALLRISGNGWGICCAQDEPARHQED